MAVTPNPTKAAASRTTASASQTKASASRAKPTTKRRRKPQARTPQKSPALTPEPMDLQAFAKQHEQDLPEAPMLSALRAEHRHIASVLALLSDHLNAIERSDLVNTAVVREIMEYMVTWLDRNHHPREDLIYGYAAELDAGIDEDRRRLERDHDAMARTGRELLNLIDRWRTGEANGAELVVKGREYVQSSYAHMSFEEQQIFPAIDATLSRSDWRELAADEQLKPIGDPVFGRRVKREFRNMARKLRRSLRRGVERRAVAEWVGVESLLEAYEVVSMAAQSSQTLSRDQFTRGLRESLYIALDKPLQAPFLCAANNARLTIDWLDELQEVYKDAAVDLLRVNRERRDRLRLLKRSERA